MYIQISKLILWFYNRPNGIATISFAKRNVAIFFILVGLVGSTLSAGLSVVYASGPNIAVAHVEGVIGPGTERYLSRVIDKVSKDSNTHVLVVFLNTPGGLIDSTRTIVNKILTSDVPIVVYVSPNGARAASAGTFIVAAADVSAMAPVSSIGAASPVGPDGELPDTVKSKVTQDMASFLRGIAKEKNRDIIAYESTVLESRSYSSSEALNIGLIDFIAEDLDDLLMILNGRKIKNGSGEVTVTTDNLTIVSLEKTLLDNIVGFLSNPTVTFVFLSIGLIGILLESVFGFGMLVPGILGVIFVLLALVGLDQLPISWAGLILMVVAMLFFYLELLIFPGMTVFGLLGLLFFATGGLLLFGNISLPGSHPRSFDSAYLTVNPWVIFVVVACSFGVVIYVAKDLLKSRTTGTNSPTLVKNLEGQIGIAVTDINPSGTAKVSGENWTAISDSEDMINAGDDIIVLEVDGLTLKVFRSPDLGITDADT